MVLFHHWTAHVRKSRVKRLVHFSVRALLATLWMRMKRKYVYYMAHLVSKNRIRPRVSQEKVVTYSDSIRPSYK